MRTVRFHFIATDELGIRISEDARLAAAIMANCLRRQGLQAATQDGTVTITFHAQPAGDPDEIFVLLEEAALQNPNLLRQIGSYSTVVVNSARPARLIQQELGRPLADVAVVDAAEIALVEGADPIAAMLGAAARAVSFIDKELLATAIWSAYDREIPYAAHAAMRALDHGLLLTQQAPGLMVGD